jgi:predicted nucleic acid-binding protein
MTLVLVDTSAWIDFFRGAGPLVERVQDCIEDGTAAFCGPIITEVLRGCIKSKERNNVYKLILSLEKLEPPESLWEDAGLLGVAVRKAGYTVKTIDLLIATYALSYNIPILTKDKDFNLIAKTGLGLVILSS